VRFAAVSEALGQDAIEVSFVAKNRSEAIAESGRLLVASGRVEQPYVDEMVKAVEDHGPYIVIAPGIALAHGRPSKLVLETGISLVTLAEPVAFGNEKNDPVRLVFGLAAFDHTAHLGMMRELAVMLGDAEIVNSLLNAVTIQQIRDLL
jgi:PTS system ascorbate-specific IIA component